MQYFRQLLNLHRTRRPSRSVDPSWIILQESNRHFQALFYAQITSDSQRLWVLYVLYATFNTQLRKVNEISIESLSIRHNISICHFKTEMSYFTDKN